jgi:acyl carrier protein
MTELIYELKVKVISSLNLDMSPEEIEDEAPLFGDGLGLDSIDALELILILEEYGIKTEDQQALKTAFASISAFAQFVDQNRK